MSLVICPPERQMKCPTGRTPSSISTLPSNTDCISLSLVCDGKEDCRGGSDERSCGRMSISLLNLNYKILPKRYYDDQLIVLQYSLCNMFCIYVLLLHISLSHLHQLISVAVFKIYLSSFYFFIFIYIEMSYVA